MMLVLLRIIFSACFLYIIPTWSQPVGTTERESLTEKLSVQGQFRMRVEGNEATDFTNNRDYFLLRLRTDLKYRVDSNLEFVLVPQFAKTFGEPTWSSSPNTGVSSQQQTSGTTTDTPLLVHEAYAQYMLAPELSFKPGRQTLSYGDELVLGKLEWNNVGRSFDAIKLAYSYEFGWSDLFFSKLVDTNTVTTGPGDTDLYGFYSSFNFLGEGKPLDVYFLYQRNGAVLPTETNLSAVGVRTTGKLSRFDYRGEATKEFGTQLADEPNAYQADIECGFTFDIASTPRLGLEGFIAGKSYNQFYPTAHKWLGYADVLGRSNLTGGVVHLSLTQFENFVTKLDYHIFSRTSTEGALIKINGASFTNAAASSSKDVGSEWDLTITHQATERIALSGGASYFRSGSYLTDQFGEINPMFYFAQLETKF